jgi:hypothetical protein
LETASSTRSATIVRWFSSISGPTLTPLVEAAADLHVAELARQLLRELVADRLGDVEAVRRRARLADVAHLGDHGALDRGVDVGVGEDEERRVAAELHRASQQALGGLLDELAPTSSSREGELAQARVAMIGLRRRSRRRGEHVEHAGGRPGLLEDLASASIDSGVCCAGLMIIVQPAATGRADLARAHRHREVPRA